MGKLLYHNLQIDGCRANAMMRGLFQFDLNAISWGGYSATRDGAYGYGIRFT